MKEEYSRKQTLMQLDISLTRKILLSVLIMVLLIAVVYCCNIPNPNMILIAGLVLCSAVFGFGGGIVSAIIMFIYTLYFFSTDYSFVRFTPQNMLKVVVSFFGIVADMLLVCSLKRDEVKAFKEIDHLTKELNKDNERLKELSMTDALTGLRNRKALANDNETFVGHEVTVMMLDLNDFKIINDTQGHTVGDHMLQETGKLLSDTFGNECCYRYGGDEFLVVAKDLSEDEFQKKLEEMLMHKPDIEIDGKESDASFSLGYVQGHMNEMIDLHKLISMADKKMYESKRNMHRKKHRISL